MLERRTVQVDDVQADFEYKLSEVIRIGDYRTALGVPLLREGVPIGVIFLTRCSVRPFTDKQIELVQTFADQAAIAIENVRLFDAEQQRTHELSESLEQQTATSEVLNVISNSLTDTQPVFEAIVQSGLRLFPDAAISVALRDGDMVKLAAIAEPDPLALKRGGTDSLTRSRGSTCTARPFSIVGSSMFRKFGKRLLNLQQAAGISLPAATGR